MSTVYAGEAAAAYFRVDHNDDRVPDLFGVAQHGVVYTSGKKKIAEHGGADPQDRHVPLVVSGRAISGTEASAGLSEGGRVDGSPVETTQIAPTILKLLGLDPNQLQAVRIEHTPALRLDGNAGGEGARDINDAVNRIVEAVGDTTSQPNFDAKGDIQAGITGIAAGLADQFGSFVGGRQ